MSKTVDELCDVFGQASGAEYERWLYDKRSDHVALAAGPALAMRRAGIAAVVRALRDESYACDHGDEWLKMLDEILGDTAEARSAGVLAVESREGAMISEAPEAPATDPAPAVCVWTYKGEARPMPSETCARYNAREVFATDKWICTCCWKPIKFTEAK